MYITQNGPVVQLEFFQGGFILVRTLRNVFHKNYFGSITTVPHTIDMAQEGETVLGPTLVVPLQYTNGARPTAKLNQLLFSTKEHQLYIFIFYFMTYPVIHL